ncbi:alcohol dehydrogenase [Gibbsiella quercinecans]|uniref:1-propanol dehydrogenase PduQ n=1 Tax=Gibbsiella quercinecans TaxID=929813 RepID=UPI000EF20710|nr:1-propanol dehydrogenase PduQ [Gibbsiella quercinecans]RLM06424.1 alcohol dehydrogenase [Gibbsiella quercinecans]
MNEFLIKPKIHFGEDALLALSSLPGRSAFLVTDQAMVKFGLAERVTSLLQQQQIRCRQYDQVASDPDISAIVSGMKLMDDDYPDLVIALGGGSVIDAAKAVMYALWHCRKDSGRSKPCFVAIPTTSGTGSEVTSFSVIKSRSQKLVLVDEFMLPDIAILDPQLVKSVPASITADTGMDVLCHALEAYVSRKASDFSDAMAEKVVQMVFGHLLTCYQQGSNLPAREKMHNASSMAGMAFTNASLGITHSLAHALGGMFGIPHGRANALLMTSVVAFNADVDGNCDTPAAHKYAALARLLGLPSTSVRDGVNSLLVAIETLKQEMQLPANLQAAGVEEHRFQVCLGELATQALHDSCTPTNPRDVNAADLERLFRLAYSGGPVQLQ